MKASKKILVAAIGMALADTVLAAACPVGTISADGQDPCFSCAPGTFQELTGQTSCNLSSPGFFVSIAGASAQTACSVGTFQSLSGASTCFFAAPGQFVSSAGQSSSTACPTGSYQPNAGSSSCLTADPGSFVGATGATAQTSCSIGTYQDQPGSAACNQASPGFFVSTAGASTATACAAGTFQAQAGQSICNFSPPGQFVSSAGQSSSTACPTGSYQPNAGSSSCLSAGPGSFVSTIGATAQTSCSIGTYQDQPGSSSCKLAIPGYFVSSAGATTQLAAPIGFFVSTAGASSAQLCPSGSVSFGASIACRAAPTTGPNIVLPVFDSNLGRGGTFTLANLINLPALETFDLNLRNDATAVGVASPLTRLSLNTLADTSLEGEISIANFTPGTTLDEGEDLDIELELIPSRLGYFTLGLNVDTDEEADLGQSGLQFGFEFKAHADGGDVAASLLADRPSIAAGDTMVVWLDASNPGNSTGINNQLGVFLPLNTSCNWTAMTEKGAIGDASNLNVVGSDIVSLPARSRVLYRARCATTVAAMNPLSLSTTILPDVTIGDLFSTDDSTATAVAVVAPEPIMSSAVLNLSVVSRTDFLQPDSLETVVYELVNDGPGDVINGNFSILTFGASEFIELVCSDQPGVNCGQVRQEGDQYRAVDTALNLTEGATMQFTLSLRTRTLEAQQLKVIATASLPPGGATMDFPDDEVTITTKGGLFNNSFE